MSMLTPIRQPQGLRDLDQDDEGRKALSRIMRGVVMNGEGSALYKGAKVRVSRGLKALDNLPKPFVWV
jgi:hypothetical protein